MQHGDIFLLSWRRSDGQVCSGNWDKQLNSLKSTKASFERLNMVQIKHESVQVLSNIPLGTGYYRIRLSCHRQYTEATPGQFVMVRLMDQIDPLLPRPFSIHRLIKNDGVAFGIELLFKVVGKGTHTLSLRQPGDLIDLTGPLGKGFTIPSKVGPIRIVAGGIGVAPMIFLVEYLKEQTHDFADVQVFLGVSLNHEGYFHCGAVLDDFPVLDNSGHADDVCTS